MRKRSSYIVRKQKMRGIPYYHFGFTYDPELTQSVCPQSLVFTRRPPCSVLKRHVLTSSSAAAFDCILMIERYESAICMLAIVWRSSNWYHSSDRGRWTFYVLGLSPSLATESQRRVGERIVKGSAWAAHRRDDEGSSLP